MGAKDVAIVMVFQKCTNIIICSVDILKYVVTVKKNGGHCLCSSRTDGCVKT